ncbi:ead/Ea22-like family protein [Escherichia coli]|nr:ead/Ea22-like family protein [Escherichia coli]EIY3297073.1 ead/Ea22-like family protein [Escherichia coli]EJZ1093790.1 ead/Ea22-like family protein [Escherichia coli]EKD5891768.1 ead/Ea22-like family protein [Escherichia coli]EKI2999501.1 ead/Ea22-like family protein [Escherichia coli]
MSKIDYQALRAKAEKATCGEWSLEYGEGRFDGDDALIHREVAGYIPICRIEGAHPESGFDEDFQMEQQANAEFIASANPATVLALLDERERNQQYIKRRDQENEDIALTVGKLRVELEAAEKRIAELQARDVKPVAWMRNANVTSFMSRFTTDEKYAVEQWGDDAVALYPLPVAFIPACFTDERNLMHINERGRETSLIWSKQNSDSGDIKLFRIAAAAGKGEES